MQLATGVGAGLAGSLLGGLISKPKTTGTEQAVLNANQGTINTQQANAQNLIPQGNNLLSMGAGAYNPVLNYWSSILSGNKGAMTSALAPEIGQINKGYDTAAQTSSVLTPRGGPRADILQDQPFQRQRDISTLFQTARPQAAQGLLNTGAAATAGGTGILGQATNSLMSSTSAGQGILQQQEALRSQQIEQGNKIGGGLFSMYQQYGAPALAKQWPSLFSAPAGGTS